MGLSNTRTMGDKRFRTRKQWHNTVVMLLSVPFAVVIGLLIGTIASVFWPLYLLIAITLCGLVVALFRDRSNRSSYTVSGDRLILSNGSITREVLAADVIDASLIERTGARDYVLQKLSAAPVLTGAERREHLERFTRFCTVDIGLRSFTFGLGRSLIDRMPNAKHDLVLLRLRDGTDHVLSPQYNQDLVASIGRILRRPSET